MPHSSVVWFRHDLRLADNPALEAAVRRGGPVLPVFIWAPEEEEDWAPGGASRWWLHHSLRALDGALRERGSRLIVRRGPSLHALAALADECGAGAVYWNRRYEPAVISRDAAIKAAVRASGREAESFNSALLHEPWTIQNRSGSPYQVFSAFWKHCLAKDDPPEPAAAPKTLPPPTAWPSSLKIDDLELEPTVDWASGICASWRPGEASARDSLSRFVSDGFESYAEARNRPDLQGTSRLSPHMHFGEIGPRQVWHAIARSAARHGVPRFRWRGSQFIAELGWREFAHHLLFHFPHTPDEPLRSEFTNFPWRRDPEQLRAWQKGRTGYPIVDAGLRELWATGWMHNRVRMIVASFLVKDLGLPWQEGARWFWDTLVDADLAQNTLGWQWTAGCGADAAPFFRIFNPTAQGEKFDPEGDYVRRWCPELAKLPAKWIHQPQNAPAQILAAAGVELGHTYPECIVNHSMARNAALQAFAMIKGKA